jgi:pilus assembly protein CpaF
LSDGSRKITSITEVVGAEGGHLEMQDIFLLERTGLGAHGEVLGRFAATGTRPLCLNRLRAYGVHLPASVFEEEQALKER